MTPSAPSVFGHQQQQQQAVPAGVMSPDEMLRAYAEGKAAAGGGGGGGMMSAGAGAVQKPKGRKMSLKGSFRGKKGGEGRERVVIGYPMPAAGPETPVYKAHATGYARDSVTSGYGAGMAGVGVGVGMAGAAYAIGEDEEDTEDAYLGHAN
jgi:hypothetical protein